VVETQPMRIPGRWREGYALHYHTLSSTLVGDDEFGHPQFSTTRSELGELLYRLKYRADRTVIAELADVAADFVGRWGPRLDAIVPVPASKYRSVQPVAEVGMALAQRLGLPFDAEAVEKSKEVGELKNVFGFNERLNLLDGVHSISRERTEGRNLLLFDDLFRSGATMNAITSDLYDQGAAKTVYALALTRTRSHS
jgi:competence protein ComFC